MTTAVRHTKHEIENSAKMAAEYGLTVRLENDGAITFIPDNNSHTIVEFDHGISLAQPTSVEGWAKGRRNEGKGVGNP